MDSIVDELLAGNSGQVNSGEDKPSEFQEKGKADDDTGQKMEIKAKPFKQRNARNPKFLAAYFYIFICNYNTRVCIKPTASADETDFDSFGQHTHTYTYTHTCIHIGLHIHTLTRTYTHTFSSSNIKNQRYHWQLITGNCHLRCFHSLKEIANICILQQNIR